jgi:hypothetical protein
VLCAIHTKRLTAQATLPRVRRLRRSVSQPRLRSSAEIDTVVSRAVLARYAEARGESDRANGPQQQLSYQDTLTLNGLPQMCSSSNMTSISNALIAALITYSTTYVPSPLSRTLGVIASSPLVSDLNSELSLK